MSDESRAVCLCACPCPVCRREQWVTDANTVLNAVGLRREFRSGCFTYADAPLNVAEPVFVRWVSVWEPVDAHE